MKFNLRKSILLAVLLVLPVASFQTRLCAQELSAIKGGLSGVITDPSGAVVPDAKVTITGTADQRVVTTDANGRYTAGSMTPGVYSMSVERVGFKTATAKNLEVVVNRSSGVSLVLVPGAATETVEVDATSVTIDTSSTAVGTNLSTTFYSAVPIARGVGSLFYTAPGVADGGGTGKSNPSIGGATGLENQYQADGVNINDAGYGGIGVFSPNYGSLGTGINLTFIEEVQVKTGAFEPKYGKANGGVVQIVTKSGGSTYHGAVAAYFSPGSMSATPYYPDNYRQAFPSLQQGKLSALPAFDASAELGGYIPVAGHHDKVFFYGAFNPSVSQVLYQAPNTPFSAALFTHGVLTTSVTSYSYAGKLTYKVSDGTTLEASVFGDPSKTNFAEGNSYAQYNGYPQVNIHTPTTFSRWDFGNRSIVARLNSAVTPTVQLTMSATMKTSHFTESGFTDTYSVSDRTPGSKRTFQGLGIVQNPNTKNYGFAMDLQKVVPLLGSHTLSIGGGFDRTIYNAIRDYSGAHYKFPSKNAAGVAVDTIGGSTDLIGADTNAAFYLASAATFAAKGCPTSLCPLYTPVGATAPIPVYLRQVRGVFSSRNVNSAGAYEALYGNDNWAIGRRVTLNLGIRWEEEQMNGPNQMYVFVDNWSPRLGINIDPFGDRKSKVFFNYGKYTQSLPYDAAIRELNQELDVTARWAAPTDGTGHLLTGADGTIKPILDSAHLLNKMFGFAPITAGASTLELFSPGTKLNYEEEYVAGLEHEFKGGIVVSARYSDRRIKRIVEDMQGISPEGANAGLPNQVYLIGNPNPTSDYFVNEQELTYAGATAPAACTFDYGPQQDSLGADLGSACATNANPNDPVTGPGAPTRDGKSDGFATPIRHYQAVEIEANKNFSHNFLMRANYRWAKLYGNYEGLFRNDNQQSDPGISSLFDFTTGKLGLLGSQFTPGFLNTDRRSVGNIYGSYVVPRGYLKKLTAGLGLRGQSGAPLNRLLSHPVYQNTGEIPFGGRGTAGRLPSTLQLDLHTDYPVILGDKGKLKLAFDVFNATNSKYIVNKNQLFDTGFQTGADPTYGTPTTFQRPFYARGSVRWEF